MYNQYRAEYENMILNTDIRFKPVTNLFLSWLCYIPTHI